MSISVRGCRLLALVVVLSLPFAAGCGGDEAEDWGQTEASGEAADRAGAEGKYEGDEPGDESTGRGAGATEVPSREELGLSEADLEILTAPAAAEMEGIDYAAFPDETEPGGSGTTYYVDADAGDDTGSGSDGAPFATIDHALATASDGDRVLVHAGAYQTDGLEVTQSDFLLAAYGDGEVYVPGVVEGAAIGLAVDQAGQHDVMVRGLVLDGFPDLGIHVGDPDTVRNVVLDSITVSRSAEGLAGWEDSEDAIVEGLWARGLTLLDVETIGFTFGQGPGDNVRITGLYVRGTGLESGDTAADGLAFEAGRNVLVENSIVERVGGDGIDLKAEQVAVVNSVVRHVGRNGIKLWQDGRLDRCLVFDTDADAQLVTEAGSYTIRDCIFAEHLQGGGSAYAATFGYDSPDEELEVSIQDSIFYRQPGPLFFPEEADVRVEGTTFWDFPDAYIEIGERSLGAEELGSLGDGNRVADPGLGDPDTADLTTRIVGAIIE